MLSGALDWVIFTILASGNVFVLILRHFIWQAGTGDLWLAVAQAAAHRASWPGERSWEVMRSLLNIRWKSAVEHIVLVFGRW